jgi:hypothetical protein
VTKRLSPSRTFIFLAGLVALTPVRMSAAAPDPFSPDGQWEYKCVDGWWPEIHPYGLKIGRFRSQKDPCGRKNDRYHPERDPYYSERNCAATDTDQA